MTSVCGHVMTLDFVGKYNNWDRVDPVSYFLFDKAVSTVGVILMSNSLQDEYGFRSCILMGTQIQLPMSFNVNTHIWI